MKTNFSWLHLTDFHQGMDEQNWIWPGVKQRFFDDLKRLHDKCGPWDLVLFTGDLTQQGQAKEFQKVNEALGQLWEQFEQLGFSPKLLAVPGNHDLMRPNEKDPSVKLLRRWNEDPDVQTAFWEDAESPYRKVVTEAFENYTAWLKNQAYKIDGLNYGILPGDFSATIEKDNVRLGIVGLNTSFLQLTGDKYEGKLILHARQFHQACCGDGPEWAKRHRACLFMTHHPPAWLTPDAQQHLNEGIVDHGRFAVQLCGHLHETAYRSVAEGGTKAKCVWQGRSLFSLESFEKANENVHRSHGYAIGKIELNEDKGRLTFWPRSETRLQGGQREIVPDQSVKLADEHTMPIEFDLFEPYNDVFISYASADNEPREKKGWITALATELHNHLGQKLGYASYSLWMDRELRENGPVPPNIVRQLENSAILLLVSSPAYFASSWCRWEISAFLAKKGPGCVFIVEREFVQRHEKLDGSSNFKFWGKDNAKTLDYEKLGDLAHQLIKSLKEPEIKKNAPEKQAEIEKDVFAPKVAPISSKPVFLAEVSEDLEADRDRVRRYLVQQEIQVLPDKSYSFFDDNGQKRLKEDLSQCRLFVQLLSEIRAYGLPRFQYELAKKAKLPILQWRNRTLELNNIQDQEHKALLSKSSIIASTLVEFQEEIISRLKPKEIMPANHPAGDYFVFIDAISEDMHLARQIRDVLKAHGIGSSLPLEISAPVSATEIQNYSKQNLLECDAVVVVYDNTSMVWVNREVLYCRRIQGRREQPFKVFAVCNKPSIGKQPFPMHLPKLHVLECPTLQAERCLPEFIRMLRA